MLTLFTTPVIYLTFDRLAVRFGRRRPSHAAGDRGPDLAQDTGGAVH
jgi:multidrug efflux pump